MLTKEKNLELLDKRISQLNLKNKVILAFDFDELVVPIHLTRKITQKISKPIDKKLLDELGSCSFKGIKYLGSLFNRSNFREYKRIRDRIVRETDWTKGFDKLIKQLSKDYSVIFISSGVKDICGAKLKEIGFDPKNILASELSIEKNEIIGLKLIISKKLKGYIIEKLKENYKIIAIGHSQGDKTMLENADVSISVNSKIPNLAQFNVRSSNELLEVIKKNGPGYPKGHENLQAGGISLSPTLLCL